MSRFSAWGLLCLGAWLTSACQLVPVPTPSATNNLLSSPAQVSTPTAITETNPAPATPQAQSSPTHPAAPAGQLVFFRNVVAGDYSLLRLEQSGEAAYINFNPLNQLLELRGGNLEPAEAADIFALLDAAHLASLEPFYDYQSSGELAVEHTYYWLRYAAEGQQPLLVGAHIQVLPGQLRPLVDRLEKLPERLPVQGASGAYLLAGEARLLNTKRYIESRSMLEAGRLQEYPVLARSLAEPYHLLPLSSADQVAVESVLNPAVSTLEVELEGMLQTIILLQAAGP